MGPLAGAKAIIDGAYIGSRTSTGRMSSGRGLAWEAMHAHSNTYCIVFLAAFLSALCGFNIGSTIGLHTHLRSPDADLLGEPHYIFRTAACMSTGSPVRRSQLWRAHPNSNSGLLGFAPTLAQHTHATRAGAHRDGFSITAARADAAVRAAALEMARESLAGAAAGDRCHTEQHAEYGGDFVVMWGETHLKVGSHGTCGVRSLFILRQRQLLRWLCKRMPIARNALQTDRAGLGRRVLRRVRELCALQRVGVVRRRRGLRGAQPQGVLAQGAKGPEPGPYSGHQGAE
jgi:hypothetical protein